MTIGISACACARRAIYQRSDEIAVRRIIRAPVCMRVRLFLLLLDASNAKMMYYEAKGYAIYGIHGIVTRDEVTFVLLTGYRTMHRKCAKSLRKEKCMYGFWIKGSCTFHGFENATNSVFSTKSIILEKIDLETNFGPK